MSWKYLAGILFGLAACISICADVTWPVTWTASELGTPAQNYSSSGQQVVVDANGNAFAVWSQTPNTSSSISNIFISSLPYGQTVWTTPRQLSNGLTSATLPVIGVDGSQNQIIAWQQPDSNTGNSSIWVATVLSNGFATVGEFSSPGVVAQNPSLSVNPSGQFVIAWTQNGISPAEIVIAEVGILGGPTSETAISSTSDVASFVRVALADNGTAYAIWQQNDGMGGNDQIFASFYNGSQWSASAFPLSPSTDEATSPMIATNASGSVFVGVWQETPASGNQNIYASVNGNTATLVSDGLNFAQNAEVAVDSSGNAIAVWSEIDPTTMNSVIQAASLPSGSSTWSQFSSPISDPTISSGDPVIAFDSTGDALVIWQQGGGFFPSGSIYASELLKGSQTWETPDLVDSEEGAGGAFVSVGGNNLAAIVYNGVGMAFPTPSPVYAAFATIPAASIPSITSPGGVFGKKQLNRFLFYGEYFNALNWIASTSSNVASYRIYRNGTLIATVSASVLTYQDHQRGKHEVDTYTVKAVDANGNESTGVSVTIL